VEGVREGPRCGRVGKGRRDACEKDSAKVREKRRDAWEKDSAKVGEKWRKVERQRVTRTVRKCEKEDARRCIGRHKGKRGIGLDAR